MVWSINDTAMSDMHGIELVIIETLLHYDGPAIFISKIGFEYYLVSKATTFEDGYLLIAASIEDEVVELLKQNRLSILGAFRSGDFIAIESSLDFHVKRYWPMPIEEFDQTLLPDAGEPLSFEIDRVADTVDQATAYFSLRLSGNGLDRTAMSFHSFKKMVDKAYISLRNLLAPNELRSSKSYTYDFRITQPEFGSLIINIERPSLPTIDKAKVVFSRDDIDGDFIAQRFSETRSSAMSHLIALKAAAKDGRISDADMAKLSFFIKDIAPLLPDRNDLYSDIEFLSQINGAQEFVSLSNGEAEAIRESYADYRNKPHDIVGKISIINEGSHNVVLKVVGTNELTCDFSAEEFAVMKQDPNFKTGNLLTVRGVVRERKRRDYMLCANAGMISVPDFQQANVFD